MQVQHKITCSKLLLTLLPFSQAIKYKKSSSKSSVAECSSTPAPLSCAGQCSHAGPAQIAHSDTLHPAAPFFTGHSGPLETKKSSIKSPVAELSAPAHLLRFLLQAIGDKNVQHKITKLSARAHLLSLSHAIKLMQVQHKIAHNRVLQHTCSLSFTGHQSHARPACGPHLQHGWCRSGWQCNSKDGRLRGFQALLSPARKEPVR